MRSLGIESLPAPRTAFFGRLAELEAIRDHFEDPDVRLLTLVGPGGIGKTRLALESARRVGSLFTDGVVFVDLSPVNDAELLPNALAPALGLRTGGATPIWSRIERAIGERSLLLVLDNLEQLAHGVAPLGDLLRQCRNARILATSRVRLRLDGEIVFPVGPLELRQDDAAAQLFIDRSRAAGVPHSPSPAERNEIGEICARLDGIPLAIELAAGLSRALSLAELLDHIDAYLLHVQVGPHDGAQRQRTLWDTIDWSYQLVGASEQDLLAGLAIFEGGFSLEAARTVGEAIAPDSDPIGALISLVENNLVAVMASGAPARRYRLLEPIREYARAQLQRRSFAQDVSRRHAEFFLALTEPLDRRGRGRNGFSSLAPIEDDFENIRAALAWFVQHREKGAALRLVHRMTLYNFRSGRLAELIDWATAALDIPGDVPAIDVANALFGLALSHWTRGNNEIAGKWQARMLEHATASGDPLVIGKSIWLGAIIAMMSGNPDRSVTLGLEAIQHLERSGDDFFLSGALDDTGFAAIFNGDAELGNRLSTQGLRLCQQNGYDWFAGIHLSDLGFLDSHQGNIERARERYLQSAELLYSDGDRWYISSPLAGLAGVASEWGAHETAALLLGRAMRGRVLSGAAAQSVERPRDDATAARARQALGDETFERLLAEGENLSLAEALELARSLTAPTGDLTQETSPHQTDTVHLTRREREVLELLAAGLTDQEIGDRLFVSKSTASTHVQNILGKLDASNRTEAANLARARGMLD